MKNYKVLSKSNKSDFLRATGQTFSIFPICLVLKKHSLPISKSNTAVFPLHIRSDFCVKQIVPVICLSICLSVPIYKPALRK